MRSSDARAIRRAQRQMTPGINSLAQVTTAPGERASLTLVEEVTQAALWGWGAWGVNKWGSGTAVAEASTSAIWSYSRWGYPRSQWG